MTKDTGFPKAVVDLIWARERGACARCGRGLARERRGIDWAIHHREPRGRGGAGKRRTWVNLPSNGLVLCTACHEWVERFRVNALDLGLIVSALGVARPTEVPVVHALYGRVLLNNDGGLKRAA
jgi:hypothetical protein